MLLSILLLWNLIVFFAFGLDKFFAKHSMRRIPEKVLITIAALLASVGACLGMLIFNHKTSKPKFRYLVPTFFLAHMALVYYIIIASDYIR